MLKKQQGNKKNPTNQEKIFIHSKGKGLENYKFSFIIPPINQWTVLKNEWELDYIDLAIFLTIYNFIGSGSANKLRITDSDGVSWYYVSEGKIIKDLPLIPINSVAAVTKRISKLCKYSLIERKPDNRSVGKKYIRIGENSQKLFYANPNIDTDSTPSINNNL